MRVHHPECNIWCGKRGHYLLPGGALGEPFSHQEGGPVAPPMAEPLREPGWYRLTEHGWDRVDDTMAEAEIADGGGWDLVHVKTAAMAETPLF